MKKILATILASALGLGAWGDATVATQAELEETISSASNGDTITLAAGIYTLYGKTQAQGKTLTFVGQGVETIWEIGGPGSDMGGYQNADYCFQNASVTFRNLKLKTKNLFDYQGFAESTVTVVENCTIDGRTAYWGYTRAMFKDTTFVVSNGNYPLWDYSSPIMILDGCTFYSSKGEFINAYNEGTFSSPHEIYVNNCTFNVAADENSAIGTSSDAKYACLYLKTENPWTVYFTGNNTANGVLPGTTTEDVLYNVNKSGNLGTTTTIYKGGMLSYSSDSTPSVTNAKTVWAEGAAVAVAESVTNSVQSANLFGAVKITGNVASNMYVAVPFEGFEADGAARKAKDVVHPANLTAETKMYVYNKTSDSHDVYKVVSGAWALAVKVTIDSNNAATLDAASLDRAVPAGTGVLVARANAGDNVYVYGQIPGAAVNPEPFAKGQTFVAPPYTNATVEVSGVKYIDLNASKWTSVSAAQQNRKLVSGADFIQFRDANNRLIKFYYDGTSWGLQPTYAKLASYTPYVEGGRALVPQGTAFWYCSSVGGAKVEWK